MNASICHIQKAFIKFAINIWMEWRGDLCQRTFGEMNAPNAGLPNAVKHKSAEANRLMDWSWLTLNTQIFNRCVVCVS